MEAIELSVESRVGAGKSAARAARRAGLVPAVLYGAARAATLVAVSAKEFELKVGAIEGTHLIRLNSAASELGGRLVLVKEVQRHPLHRHLVHADLYEVDVNTRLTLKVALHFIGRAAGVDVGGVLQPVRREVEVLCLPTEIPDYIEVDVSSLGIHDALHLSDLKSPAGVEIIMDTDEAVVTVLPPVVEEVKVAAEGAPVAGEGAGATSEGAKVDAAKASSAAKAAS